MKITGATLFTFALLAGATGACGDDSGNDDDDDGDIVIMPDARPDSGPVIDASPDAAPLPAGCDYLEMNDLGNGATMPAEWELTQATVTTNYTTCGTLNNGHFVPDAEDPAALGVIDQDAFQITLGATSNLYFSFSGTGLAAAPNAQFAIFDLASGDPISFGSFYGDHGAAAASAVPAGDYLVLVGAYDTMDAAATATYKLRTTIEATQPCPAVAGAAMTTEVDGANNTGNDVFLIGQMLTLTPNAADAPNLVVAPLAPASSTKIAGNSAAQNVVTTDAYYDGDTYEFTTGATTTQARVRLNWPATAPLADVDFYIVEKPAAGQPPSVFVSTAGATVAAEEYVAAALKPNTTYWLYVGGYQNDAMAPNPTADGYPKDYTLQVCGEAFTAP